MLVCTLASHMFLLMTFQFGIYHLQKTYLVSFSLVCVQYTHSTKLKRIRSQSWPLVLLTMQKSYVALSGVLSLAVVPSLYIFDCSNIGNADPFIFQSCSNTFLEFYSYLPLQHLFISILNECIACGWSPQHKTKLIISIVSYLLPLHSISKNSLNFV